MFVAHFAHPNPSGFTNSGNVRKKFMPHQYKREPLNNDEVDKIINSCGTSREKFVICPVLDTALTLS